MLACSSARSTTARQCTLRKASDLHRPGAADVGDHDLLTVVADRYRLPGRAGGAPEYCRDRTRSVGVLSDRACHPERRGERHCGQPVQSVRLLGEHPHRQAATDPVRPRLTTSVNHVPARWLTKG